ncbi:MAG: hypothetical protein ACKVJN_07440 [Woeseiales bacterium]
MLTQYWMRFFVAVSIGDPWSHKNYWGAEVGTTIVLSVLIVATPAYFVAAWRYRSHHWRFSSGRKGQEKEAG